MYKIIFWLMLPLCINAMNLDNVSKRNTEYIIKHFNQKSLAPLIKTGNEIQQTLGNNNLIFTCQVLLDICNENPRPFHMLHRLYPQITPLIQAIWKKTKKNAHICHAYTNVKMSPAIEKREKIMIFRNALLHAQTTELKKDSTISYPDFTKNYSAEDVDPCTAFIEQNAQYNQTKDEANLIGYFILTAQTDKFLEHIASKYKCN